MAKSRILHKGTDEQMERLKAHHEHLFGPEGDRVFVFSKIRNKSTEKTSDESGLDKILAELDVPSGQNELYKCYFRELWERKEAIPPMECNPDIIKKVQAFTDDLRDAKRDIFGE